MCPVQAVTLYALWSSIWCAHGSVFPSIQAKYWLRTFDCIYPSMVTNFSMGTRCSKGRAIVIDICRGINWPINHIEHKRQRSPEHSRLSKLTPGDSRFSTAIQRTCPLDMKREPKAKIDKSQNKKDKQQLRSNPANAHASCRHSIILSSPLPLRTWNQFLTLAWRSESIYSSPRMVH
jgi:hypothetical protein